MKINVIVLSIVTVGLGAGLLIQHHHAAQTAKTLEEARTSYSNSWQEAKAKFEDTEKVAAALETKLNQRTEALTVTSNDLVKTSTDLAQVQANLAKIQTDYNAAQSEVKNQQAQIAQLESQRDDLSKKMDELTGSINSLESKIADTKQKLATSEGDRAFLLKELSRLQTEKATLVAQFNNLSALRAQVSKLKEEAAINQRLAWMQSGLYNLRDKKGAERLLVTSPVPAKPENRLEIELEQNGRGRGSSTPSSTPPGQ